MKKIRYITAAAVIVLLITMFTGCNGKNTQILGADSEYPCQIVKKGSSCVLSVASKSGYTWKAALEDGGAFTVEQKKADDKETVFNIIPGTAGTVDTLRLTLEKNDVPVPMAAYRIDVVFHNEHTGEFSVFASSFTPLTGDVVYGENTGLPYTMLTGEDGRMTLTVFNPAEDSDLTVSLGSEDIVSVAYGEKTEKTQQFLVSPVSAGGTELVIGLSEGEALLRFPVLVTEENALSVSQAQFEQSSLVDTENEYNKTQLNKAFGEIRFPAGTVIDSCTSSKKALTEGKTSLWGQYVIKLSDERVAGYLIASNQTAEGIVKLYSKDGKAEKTKLGDKTAYSFKNKTDTDTVTWDSEDGNAAFIVTSADAKGALEIAGTLAELNPTVKDVPVSESETAVPESESAENETAAEETASSEDETLPEDDTLPEDETLAEETLAEEDTAGEN